jgi:hypothetical protein
VRYFLTKLSQLKMNVKAELIIRGTCIFIYSAGLRAGRLGF